MKYLGTVYWCGMYLALFFISTASLAMYAQAQEYLFKNPISHRSITELLLALLDGVIIILIPIISLGIVFIGFKMVLAGHSKPEEFVRLKLSFMYALIGLFLVLGARGILSVVQNTVGGVLNTSSSFYNTEHPNIHLLSV